MSTLTINANGNAKISITAGQSIAVQTDGKCKVYYESPSGNIPKTFYYHATVDAELTVFGSFSANTRVMIDAGTEPVYYAVATTPRISAPTNQQTVAAKTTDATLTAAEVLSGIITVNQGASGTSTLTLPLATAMDTALPNFNAGNSIEFSLINISTDAAEDADIATNTGWTLVGSMAVQSNDAITSKSAGRFQATKTAAGAWTLYRLS